MAQNDAPPGRSVLAPRSSTRLSVPLRTNVVLDVNPSLFAVMAAINVAGYDSGLDTGHSQELRRQIRDRLLAKQLPVYGELREFYQRHLKADPGLNLAQYVSLALLIGDPPDFKVLVPPQDLPPDASAVLDFLPLLRRFYDDAGVNGVWNQYRPVYEKAVDDYSPAIRRVMSGIDSYFRLPQQYLGRQLFIYPEVLAAAGQTHARNYLDNYYIVVNLDVSTQMDDIRHTYLHYVLDPMVSKYGGAVRRMDGVLPLVARAPALDPQFKHDMGLFYTECLVRAVEIRLSGKPIAERQRLVEDDVAEGLTLTRPFYQMLLAYDKDVVSFNEFYPDAAYNLDVAHELNQARRANFVATAAHRAPVQPLHLVSLLQAGEEQLRLHDLDGASRMAAQALQTAGADHAAAHYLLAVVATQQQHPDLAQSLFEKALAEAPLTEGHVRTWANIYLGRLLDLQQQRSAALTHYQAALATADTPVAREIAQRGLHAPFASGHPHAIK
ncbi:MAG: hypothetical protein ACYC6M_08235 [Terriglobales bacterium]